MSLKPEFFDELGEPLLCLTMSRTFFDDANENVIRWLESRKIPYHGDIGSGLMIYFLDEDTKTEFKLVWS